MHFLSSVLKASYYCIILLLHIIPSGSQTLMPAVSDSQFEQEVLQSPEEQFRSDIPEQNITMGGLPDMSGQTASVFPQTIPQSEALPQSPADELAASEYKCRK